MPSNLIPFIGRTDELGIILKLLREWNTSHLLFIHSEDGGVGKTRLLQEVFARYGNLSIKNLPITVPEIIDFDDPLVQSRGTLQRRIAKVIGDKYFNRYLQRMLSWRSMEEKGIGLERMMEESYAIQKAMFECLNQETKNRRIALLLDTTDHLEGEGEILEYIRDLVKETGNILVIMAGRKSKNLYERSLPILKSQTSLIILEPLNPEDADGYITKALEVKETLLDQMSLERLETLAKGRPILLDLAIDQISKEPDFERVLNDVDRHDLVNASPEAVMACERALVKYLEQSRSPFDQTILLLAHVYPLDKETITYLLPTLQDQNLEILFDTLNSSVLIKSLPQERYSLHDDIRRMVMQYVWPEIDPNGLRRQGYSRKATQILDERIKETKKRIVSLGIESVERDDLLRELDVLELESLRHLFVSDLKAGIDKYTILVLDALKKTRRRFANKLTRIAQDFYSPDLSEAQRYRLDMVRVKVLTEGGQQGCSLAKDILANTLLPININDKSRLREISNSLGRCEERLGELDSALEHELMSLSLSEGETTYSQIANYIGYIYRRMGNWDQAIRYYKLSLSSINERAEDRLNLVAATLNNLAYAVCLQGNYNEAKLYCEQAIAIWESQKDIRFTARAWVTRAIIYRDRGNYDEAAAYFNRTISLLGSNPDDNYQTLIAAHFEHGWNLWFQAESLLGKRQNLVATESGVDLQNQDEDVSSLLMKSKENFEKAEALSNEYGYIVYLPGILNQSSNVYWLLGDHAKARENVEEAYKISLQYHDIRYAIDSLLGFAEFDYAEGICEHIEEYARMLKQEYEDRGYDFPLFFGRMRRIQGTIALKNKDYLLSRELIAQGIAMISQHGGYGMYFIDRELATLKALIDDMPQRKAIEWLTFVRDYWEEHDFKDVVKRGTLLGWCQTQLIRLSLASF